MGMFIGTIIKIISENMKYLIILASALYLGYALPKDLFHAECSVKWTVSVSCEETQTKIVNQMILWRNDWDWDNTTCGTKPGDSKPNGQKCLYKHDRDEGLTTYGTHTTPIQRYVDDLTFKFVPSNDGSCLIDANSISESLSLLDFGTNYCNLFNLMDGSGLTKDEAYSEETDDGICTQHSSANCEIY